MWVGRDPRRQHRAIVIRVRHDDRADQSRAHPPARRPGQLLGIGTRYELDAAGLGEVLAQKVRGSRLDGFAILYHGLDAERLDGAGKALAFALFAGENRQGQVVPRKGLVNAQHASRLFSRLGLGLVREVCRFLPEEFRGPQKQPGTQFPTHHIRPLIDHERKIAIGLDPLGIGRSDDRFTGRANDQRLGQFRGRVRLETAAWSSFQPVMRDHRALLWQSLPRRSASLAR